MVAAIPRPRRGENHVYRWTLAGDLLRLEYLHFGEADPVHLFDLAQASERE
jgi:hypothetical protein